VALGDYSIELANRICGGRVVGTDYVVTRRPLRLSGVLFRSPLREIVVRWVLEAQAADDSLPGMVR
jgi:hypothetical protein